MEEPPLFGTGSKPPNRSPKAVRAPEKAAVRQTVVKAAPAIVPCQPTAPAVQSAPAQASPGEPTAPPVQVPAQQPVAAIASPQSGAQQSGTQEDRKEKRNRSLKGGLIILQGQMMSSFACKIRNESRSGVMLVLPDATRVPAEFYLVRDADPGHKVPCRVAWRSAERLGVKFVAALSPL